MKEGTAAAPPAEIPGNRNKRSAGRQRSHPLTEKHTGPFWRTAEECWSSKTLVIEDPQLWWPNGLGDQPLYDVEVSMRIGEKECDVWKKRIGLRTLTVKREKDAWGESFAHEVNGVCFFAMGADYILLGRRSRERTQRLLEDCRLANFNSIRVWGGGFYPDDWFYDLCDELGLVVWQDFMFACSVYELTEEFYR